MKQLDGLYRIQSTRNDEISIEYLQKLSLLVLSIVGLLYGGYMLYKGFTTDYYCGYSEGQKYSEVNMTAYNRHCSEVRDIYHYKVN
jgi:hypothetical protein